MVAAPNIGSKRARSERNDDEFQTAGVGLNETLSHPRNVSVQNDAKSIAEEDGKCTRFSFFQPVEKKTTYHVIDNMIGTSLSEMQTSHVEPKE